MIFPQIFPQIFPCSTGIYNMQTNSNMHQLVILFHAAQQCHNSCVCINANYTYSEQLPIAQQRQIFATHFSLNHLGREIVQSKLHLKVHLNQTLFGVLLSGGDEAGRAAAVGATIPFLDLTFPIVI